tara:strand:+ start:6801 stop:7031 length:231 start_codon:yes stop_codon:yes gene_type:complete
MEMNFGEEAINGTAYDWVLFKCGMGTGREFTGKQWRSCNGTWGSAGRWKFNVSAVSTWNLAARKTTDARDRSTTSL